ncbi:hypothetical protein FOA52_007335 [Chlamydomonas sp. UWO 241]|nr:hypothetical protein FOA52_007335 [Chlamydomonas sp. UWO 241]
MDAAAEAPPPAKYSCDALDLLPFDLWAHALEQLEEKRDVVHAAACCRSLVPMAGVGNMLNWEVFNSWYLERFDNGVEECMLPICDGMGPEVLRAGVGVMLQDGTFDGAVLHGDYPIDGFAVYASRAHAMHVQGPATAGDVLSALMKQALGLSDERLFESFAKHFFPSEWVAKNVQH